MADSVAIKITADIVDLQTKFTLAKAQSQQLSTELNKLAREAVNAGGATPQLNSQLQQLATRSIAAKQQVAALSAQLKPARDSTRELADGMGIATEAMSAFGVGLSIGAVAEFGKSVFEAAQEIYHQAEVMGLSVSAYQAFAKSAELSGVEIETVDQALRKFNVSQGLAQTGTGNQAKAFNDLGVSAQLPAEEAIPALARALLSIDDNGRSARDSVAIFGKSAEELRPVFDEWAGGVDKLIIKLKELGVFLDPELIKKAHDAKIAQDIMWEQVDGAWGPAIIKLEGMLARLGHAYVEFLDLASTIGDELGKAFDRGPTGDGGFRVDIDPADVAPLPKSNTEAHGPAPKPNWTDKADGEKAAKQAQQIADEIARAYEQGAQRHIQSEEQTNAYLLGMGQETLAQWRTQAVALEDARYQAAVDGIKKREAADANDKVKLAADRAQEAQLYQEHADRLTAIDQQYNEKKRQEEQASVQAYIAEHDEQLQAAIAKLDQEFQHQQITAQQKHDAEVQLTHQIEQQVLERLDAEIAGLTQGTAAYEAAMKQRAEIAAKYNKQVQTADQQLGQAQAQQWETANRQIISAESGFISSLFSGRQSLGQSVVQLFEQMLERELTADLAYWTERELLSMEGIGKEKVTEQEGFLWKILFDKQATDSVIDSQAAQTGAVITGATARAAAETASSAVGNAAQAAAGSTSIMNDAKVAAANTYAAVSEIPVVGPFLAPAAAAAAYVGVMAFDTLTSLDVGTNYVPVDMPAMIHQGERIIPAADNAALMAAVTGNQSSQRGGSGGPFNLSVGNITIQGVPGNNPQTARNIINAIAVEIRNGNTTLRDAAAT